MTICTSCKKKQQQKTIANLFNVNNTDISVSKTAHQIEDAIFNILKKDYTEKILLFRRINQVLSDMFYLSISNHVQRISNSSHDETYFNNNIIDISLIRRIQICKDKYTHNSLHDYDTQMIVKFEYTFSKLSIELKVIKKASYHDKILSLQKFEVNDKQDFYAFISKLAEFAKLHEYKFNSKFDFNSTELDSIFKSFIFTKFKQHSEKTLNDVLTNLSDKEKIVNMFLTAKEKQRIYIKQKLYNLM